MAKVYEINFYQQPFSKGMSSEVETICLYMKKVFQIFDLVLPTEQSIKSSTFIFQGFCLNFKSTLTIFKNFMNNFWNDFRRTPYDG